MSGQHDLQRVVVGETNEFQIDHILQRDGLLVRERVPARHDQHQRVGAERHGDQPLQIHMVRGDAQLSGAGAQGVGDLLAGAVFDVHRDARMLGQK